MSNTTHSNSGSSLRTRPAVVVEAFSTATAGGGRRTQQITAASAAIWLIARQIGRNAALVVLWDAFERVAAATIEEDWSSSAAGDHGTVAQLDGTKNTRGRAPNRY